MIVVEECPKPVAAAGVAQFSQRLRLNLPDPLAGHREVLAYLFERMFRPVLKTEPHLDDLFLARAQGLQYFGRLLAKVEVDHCL